MFVSLTYSETEFVFQNKKKLCHLDKINCPAVIILVWSFPCDKWVPFTTSWCVLTLWMDGLQYGG